MDDLLPKPHFYEIDRSYQFRNIFVPLLIFGFEDEFSRVMQLISAKGLARKFELKSGYFKDLVLSLDIMRDPMKPIRPFRSQRWEDPFTYISHKAAQYRYLQFSRDLTACILKKDYSEYCHKESDIAKTLRDMRASGIYESQKMRFLNLFSKITDSEKAIGINHSFFSLRLYKSTAGHRIQYNSYC